MKKIVILIIILSLASGCGCTSNKANNKASNYLKEELDKNIISLINKENDLTINDSLPFKTLEKVIDVNELFQEELLKYEKILKNLSSKMKYEKLEEKKNEDGTILITAKISFYDLNKIRKETEDYKLEHINDFLDEEGYYDKYLFIDYQLEQMKNADEMVDYILDILIMKENGNYDIKSINVKDNSLNQLYEEHTLDGLNVEIRKINEIDDIWYGIEINISNTGGNFIKEGYKALSFEIENAENVVIDFFHNDLNPGEGYRLQIMTANKDILSATKYDLIESLKIEDDD